METLSKSLADAFSEIADLDLVCLPGRHDGRPPSALRLAQFLVSATVSALRKRGSADVVVLGDFVLAFLAVAHKWLDRSARVVVIVHGLDVLYASTPGVLPRFYAVYVGVMARLFRRTKIEVYANSVATADVARAAGLEVVDVIPLAVELPDLGEDHASERDRHAVLFVGRLVPRKGARWFVSEVLPLLEGTQMIIVGPPTDQAEVRSVSTFPGVDYLGSVPDEVLASHRRKAWIVVVPNQQVPEGDIEGFGLTAVESAAAGCVVVSSDIDGLSDALGGGIGVLVEPADTGAWAKKIRDVQGWTPEQYAAFVSAARQQLSERSSWRSVAEAILLRAEGA